MINVQAMVITDTTSDMGGHWVRCFLHRRVHQRPLCFFSTEVRHDR